MNSTDCALSSQERLGVPDIAAAVRAEASRRGVNEDNRVLTGPLARRIRGLLEDGRLPHIRVRGRYFVGAEHVPLVADLLGLQNDTL